MLLFSVMISAIAMSLHTNQASVEAIRRSSADATSTPPPLSSPPPCPSPPPRGGGGTVIWPMNNQNSKGNHRR